MMMKVFSGGIGVPGALHWSEPQVRHCHAAGIANSRAAMKGQRPAEIWSMHHFKVHTDR
jgi:hypothetical protein